MYIPALTKTIRVDCAKTREKIAEDVAKAARRTGVLLDDMEVILAMENIPDGGRARFIPVNLSGKGSDRRLAQRNQYLISGEQFGIFKKHVGKLLKDMSDEVENGCIECDPYVNGQDCACDSCDYLPICQFDTNKKTDRYRQFKKMKREDFFESKTKGGAGDGLDE
jgi:ATP-dependent helicase/nuclease subunit B